MTQCVHKVASETSQINKQPRRSDSFPLIYKPKLTKTRRSSAPGVLVSKIVINAFRPKKQVRPPQILDDCPKTELREGDITAMYCAKNKLRRMNIADIAAHKIPREYRTRTTKLFYLEMIIDIVFFCQFNNMSPKKCFFLTRIYIEAHRFFLADPWCLPHEIYEHFRELLLRHSIQHPPKSIEIFECGECVSILYHFHRTYLHKMPLIRHICHPTYKLQINWKNVPVELPPPEKKTKKKKK